MGQLNKMEILKFDTKRKRVDKCPCCGHDNKNGGYVPYIGTDAGYCHYCNSTCFPDENRTLVTPEEIQTIQRLKLKKAIPSYVPNQWHELSLNKYDNNDFIQFLLGRFGQARTTSIVKRYRLGTKDNKVIFWQIDRDKKVRTGKIMDYNSDTGKRGNHFQWVHKSIDNFNLIQCFFGEHLITKNKPISIVESEKTACIMSEIIPNRTWIACGGSSGITQEKSKVLKGRNNVILFPDQGKYQDWKEVSRKHFQNFAEVSLDCDIWFEENRIDKSDDIADYYLKNYDLKPQKKCGEWNQDEYDEIFG